MKKLLYVAVAMLAATNVQAAPKKAPAKKAVVKKAVIDAPIKVPLKPVVPAAKRVCTKLLPSGLGYKQLKAGEGDSPSSDDVVLVNYVGYFRSNGEVFDQNEQSAFPVAGVIPGFSEGLKQMKRGEIARLCIPAAIGYGAEGTPDGTIPPNANLGFQVELLEFKSRAEIEALQAEMERQQAVSDEQPEPEPAVEAPPAEAPKPQQ